MLTMEGLLLARKVLSYTIMNALIGDLRLAFRAVGRRPGVAAVVILSLAMAVGFSTAAFSVVDAYYWRELLVHEPGRLVRIGARDRQQRVDSLSWVEYEAIASRAHSLIGVAAETRHIPKVRLPDRDDFPITAGVSENYFDVLGVPAALGRVFHKGTAQGSEVVITDHYWSRALGRDPFIVGRKLPVGRGILNIIGVLPPGFKGTGRGLLVDLYVPPQTYFGTLSMGSSSDVRETDYELIARLRSGATLGDAGRDVDAVLRQLEQDGFEPDTGRRAAAAPFAESSLRAKLTSTAVFDAMILLVLLIAGMNLANLRLVDNETRRVETGMRIALGAGRGALLRQHLSETLLLSGLGAAAGLLLAAWLIDLVAALLYAGQPYIDYGIRMDLRTLGFSCAALVVLAIIGALIPLRDSWKRGLAPILQARWTTRSSRWLTALVVCQMALVTAATCSAGLLWRSLENVAAIRPAMDPDRSLLLVEGAWAGGRGIETRTEVAAARLTGLPGVQQAAYARRASLSGSGGGAVVEVEFPPQQKFTFHFNQVSPNYFAATGARVLKGRPFAVSDGAAATPVILISQKFEHRFFSDENPVGAFVRAAGRDRQVVGVVEDGPTNDLREQIEPYVYFPFAQRPSGDVTFLLHTTKDPGSLAASVRKLLRASDAQFTIIDVASMRQHMRAAHHYEELEAVASAGLAILALILAAAGLFGVTSFAVSRRMREFGIRMALGATGAALHREVLKEAASDLGLGIPLGWLLAFASRKAIQNHLYGISATDPWTLATATVIVIAVAGVAAAQPARRAAAADPAEVLRHE